jgi:hypothetical protein
VIVLALVFLVLGTTVGRSLQTPAEPRAVPDASVVAPPSVRQPPERVGDTAAAPPLPATPPAPPVAQTPAERAESIIAHPEANLGTLKELVVEDSDAARQTLALVMKSDGRAAELLLSVVGAQNARQHVKLIGTALSSGSRARALSAIEVLEALRSLDAIALLDAAARDHPDGVVRERARVASKVLFDPGGDTEPGATP